MSESKVEEKAYENLRSTLTPEQVWDICVLIYYARRHPMHDWEFDHVAQDSFVVPDIDGTLMLLANRFRSILDDGSEFNPVVQQPGEEGEDSVA